MSAKSTQQHNLSELVTEIQKLKVANAKGEVPVMSPELMLLLEAGLHHSLLPDTLQPKTAEMFQLAAEAMGGLPRLLLWADRNPGAFYKLLARQTIPTIAPVLPPPDAQVVEQWPEWLTARRLAYQEEKE